jgi:hypothetical protein
MRPGWSKSAGPFVLYAWRFDAGPTAHHAIHKEHSSKAETGEQISQHSAVYQTEKCQYWPSGSQDESIFAQHNLPHTFSMFVIQRSKVATMLSNHYSNTNTVPYATQLVYLSIESSSCPAFPTSIGRMIGFLRSSRVSFGDNCILVMGNWPRATPRFTNQLGGSGWGGPWKSEEWHADAWRV